jgi:hypothetical protein
LIPIRLTGRSALIGQKKDHYQKSLRDSLFSLTLTQHKRQVNCAFLRSLRSLLFQRSDALASRPLRRSPGLSYPVLTSLEQKLTKTTKKFIAVPDARRNHISTSVGWVSAAQPTVTALAESPGRFRAKTQRGRKGRKELRVMIQSSITTCGSSLRLLIFTLRLCVKLWLPPPLGRRRGRIQFSQVDVI